MEPTGKAANARPSDTDAGGAFPTSIGTSRATADIAAANASAWPFVQPPIATLRASNRKVFAHYFTPFPISIDNRAPGADYYSTQFMRPEGERNKYQAVGGFLKERPLPREIVASADWSDADMELDIRRAAALGIDGFALDILATAGPQWDRAQRLLQLAAKVDPGFKIVLMPDMQAEFKAHPEELAPTLKLLGTSPAAYRLSDGRLVVAPYNAQNQTPDWWKGLFADLKASGIDVAFFPVFQNWEKYANDYASISIGMSDWGVRSPNSNRGWIDAASHAHQRNVLWMAPASPQDERPKSTIFWEANGSENYRLMWMNAISGGADWAQVITWNDYSEASEISPSTGIQWSFYDLTAYYVAWFKTGQAPKITKDVLYYFYRVNSPRASAKAQATPYKPISGSEPATGCIEALSFLAKPGTLSVQVGQNVYSRDVPAGMTSFRVPSAAGRPEFKVIRNGRAAIDVKAPFAVLDDFDYADMLYRGGSNTRAPIAPQ